jgi:hypothetical protein
MRKWKTGAGALLASLAIGLAGVVLVACGDDSDEQSGTDQTKASTTQEAPDPRAAQRLETYLEQNTKELVGNPEAPPGQVVNDVQPADGKLTIYALLNAHNPSHKAPAREICRVSNASGCRRLRAPSSWTLAASCYSAAERCPGRVGID